MRWGMLPSLFAELERVKEEMDRFFEEISEGILKEPAAGVFPLVNLTEDENNYYVRAELPGIKPEELDISVTENTLTISGERKIKVEGDVDYHRKEREEGRFSRAISLPGEIDPDKVEARCKNGILTVILPKAEKTKPRKISIKSE